MVQLSLPSPILIPEVLLPGEKKSKILLLLMVFPLLRGPALNPIMALEGKLAPAGPMLQNEMVLPLLPVLVPPTTN